jgi:hypothetical protein
MAQKKVNLRWISNNATRRATYKRRYQALTKKAGELVTLCGIKICIVVYGDGLATPELWPSDAEAKKLLKKFKDMPNVGSFKKIQNQEEFLHSRTVRLHEQVSKLDHENHERETLVLLYDSLDGCRPGLIGTTKDELISLREMVETKMSKAKARLQELVVEQGALTEPLQVMQSVSSSSCTQASPYTYNEMQTMATLEEHQLQQDWPIASPCPNFGEIGTMLYSAFVGSSRDASGSGCEIMKSYNLGSCSGLPWAL